MTDNEIIKALEICTNGECPKGCPYAKVEGCMEQNGADALSIINRQKAEIERLENGLAISRKETKRYIAFKGGRGFGKQFFFSELVKQAKAEAIKEFVERLKAKYSQADILCPRRIVSLTEKDLDNLVKEMVGDNNE